MKLILYFLGGPFKRNTPEHALFEKYYSCAQRLNFCPVEVVYPAKGTTTSLSWPSPAHAVALEEKGRLFSSEALSQKMEQWSTAHKHVVFVVGDAHSIPEILRKQCQEQVSLGPLTWPHRLARVLLMEQVYRSFSILLNKPYHHE